MRLGAEPAMAGGASHHARAQANARLLYLTNRFPYPLTSGQLRHYFFIRELAPRYAITLISVVESSFRGEHAAALAPFTERILTIPLDRHPWEPWLLNNRARSMARSMRTTRLLRQVIQQLLLDESFEVIISGKRTYRALAGLSDLPLVADVCDATSMRIKRSMRYGPVARLPGLVLDYGYTRLIEKRLMGKAVTSLFISRHDRQAIAGKDEPGTAVVPNGIDLSFWQRAEGDQEPAMIVFSGVMNYWPNTDAALHLIKEIFPLIKQVVPQARLVIVGRDPPPQLVEANQQPGITVTGFVEDMRPYLERATVFAVPLRFGAGQQNKVLEALAMELPVVASAMAVEGLRTETGDQPPIDIAEGSQEFAEKLIAHLIKGPALNRAARPFLKANFSWDSSCAKLERVIENAIHSVET